MKTYACIIAGVLCLGSIKAAEPTTANEETGQVKTTNAGKQKTKDQRSAKASGGDLNAHNGQKKTGYIQPHFVPGDANQGTKVQRESANHDDPFFHGSKREAAAHNDKEKVGVAVGDVNKTQIGTEGGIWHPGDKTKNDQTMNAEREAASRKSEHINPFQKDKAGLTEKTSVAAGDVNKTGREAASQTGKGKKADLPNANTVPTDPDVDSAKLKAAGKNPQD